jgi:tryptophan synthase alpha chain
MSTFTFSKKAIGIFLTAYYPSKDRFVEQLLHLQEEPIDFIEIGIPYSDPIADGPVIQVSSEIALQQGFTIGGLFDILDELKSALKHPLVLMGYGNQVLQYGIDRFIERCENAGIKALIFPDLPIEMLEAKHPQLLSKKSIPFVHLVTPSTSDERIQHIASACKNSFVYLVGSSQTTGGTYRLEDQLERYQEIKTICGTTPVFLGFGIDSFAKKEIAHTICDGVIIGSAYLKAVASGKDQEFLRSITSNEQNASLSVNLG